MKNVNSATILGYVKKDPQINRKENLTIANFVVATSDKYKDKETTEWHNIVAYGKLAEIVESYIKKGSLIYLDGKLKTDQYEKDGITRYSTKIIASEIILLNSKQQGITNQLMPAAKSETVNNETVNNEITEPFGDVPF